MIHFKNLIVAITIFLTLLSLSAQGDKCSTMNHLSKSLSNDPSLSTRMAEQERATQAYIQQARIRKSAGVKNIITIPTVVHVIWNDPVENVSDNQIFSQIAVLNEDLRLLNSDSLDSQHPFWSSTADTEIEFCLASQDPDGNPTNGITRTQTNVVVWDDNNEDDIKYTASGGRDNWDATRYLNIYVVNLDGTTLGFATFPDELATNPDDDGVVIRYEAFGTEGTAGTGTFSANDLGRTGTHEVGHWLNLRHIWGDSTCGDDFVSDTEPAEEANYDCPSFPHRDNNACGSGADGEMYMNYMDYSDDNCLIMFTAEQALRMQAALNGPRSGLLSSNGCQVPSNTKALSSGNAFSIYPNPSNTGIFNLEWSSSIKTASVVVEDIMGRALSNPDEIQSGLTTLNLSYLSPGAYLIRIESPNTKTLHKIFIH
jgi:hypothetical protein